jgi:UPF0716 protein FxsA
VTPGRRRRFPAWLLVLAFVVVPLVEIWALIQVGRVIGAWWTIALLLADSLLGAWLIKREGRRAWQALTGALGTGRMPARELADGALILVGGTLMLTPGFVTDVVALFLIVPVTRPLARRALTRVVARRLVGSGPWSAYPSRPGSDGPDARRPGAGGGPVVRGEVVDDD